MSYVYLCLRDQFQKPPVRIPTRSITLAILLCFSGTVLLCIGIMVLTGQLDPKVKVQRNYWFNYSSLIGDESFLFGNFDKRSGLGFSV
jgi:hypothetical protein